MKLEVSFCSREKKSDLKKMRAQGWIPAVLYRKGENSEKIRLSQKVFEKFLTTLEEGHLSTTQFRLALAGRELDAVVKGIEYGKVHSEILHLDFQELGQGMIQVRIPIVLAGVADCEATRAGFILKQARRYVKAVCPTHLIPEDIVISVQKLQPREKIRVKDLPIPEGVTLLAPSLDLVVTASK